MVSTRNFWSVGECSSRKSMPDSVRRSRNHPSLLDVSGATSNETKDVSTRITSACRTAQGTPYGPSGKRNRARLGRMDSGIYCSASHGEEDSVEPDSELDGIRLAGAFISQQAAPDETATTLGLSCCSVARVASVNHDAAKCAKIALCGFFSSQDSLVCCFCRQAAEGRRHRRSRRQQSFDLTGLTTSSRGRPRCPPHRCPRPP